MRTGVHSDIEELFRNVGEFLDSPGLIHFVLLFFPFRRCHVLQVIFRGEMGGQRVGCDLRFGNSGILPSFQNLSGYAGILIKCGFVGWTVVVIPHDNGDAIGRNFNRTARRNLDCPILLIDLNALSLSDSREREHGENNASELDLTHGIPPAVEEEIRS
jgi:hypothetical protein